MTTDEAMSAARARLRKIEQEETAEPRHVENPLAALIDRLAEAVVLAEAAEANRNIMEDGLTEVLEASIVDTNRDYARIAELEAEVRRLRGAGVPLVAWGKDRNPGGTSMTDVERIAAIEARLAERTRGEWVKAQGHIYVSGDGYRVIRTSDSKFIANAPEDLRYLLDRLRAAEGDGFYLIDDAAWENELPRSGGRSTWR